MISIQALKKSYRSGSTEVAAVRDINLLIGQGELIAITGPSGCGKSTLLNILGMIDRPDSGTYLFEGTPVTRLGERSLASVRKKNIGFIFQSFNLIDELTVSENVALPLLYMNISARERKERVGDLLASMNLSHRKDHYPRQLSGGQQQRVAVARAMSNKPKLILADEPTGNLDTRNGDEVMKQLLELNSQGTTVIIVTHSNQYAAYCSRHIRLLDGSILSEQIKDRLYV